MILNNTSIHRDYNGFRKVILDFTCWSDDDCRFLMDNIDRMINQSNQSNPQIFNPTDIVNMSTPPRRQKIISDLFPEGKDRFFEEAKTKDPENIKEEHRNPIQDLEV